MEFPERAGALARFLSVVSPAFNVTLFHYRRTGANGWPSMRAGTCVQAALHLRTGVCVTCHIPCKTKGTVRTACYCCWICNIGRNFSCVLRGILLPKALPEAAAGNWARVLPGIRL